MYAAVGVEAMTIAAQPMPRRLTAPCSRMPVRGDVVLAGHQNRTSTNEPRADPPDPKAEASAAPWSWWLPEQTEQIADAVAAAEGADATAVFGPA